MDDELLKVQELNEDRRRMNAKRPAHKDSVETANLETLRDYAKFYSFMGTISGGAIVLSVSFLSLIKKLDRVNILWRIDNINLLQLSWIAFGITIMLTLSFNKKHLDALYWDTIGEHADFEEKDKQNELELLKLGRVHVLGATIEEQTRVVGQNQQFWKQQKTLADTKRKSAQNWNQTLVKFIHAAFLTGIVSLILFALITLGV